LAYDPNSTFVPSSIYDPCLKSVPYFVPIMVSYSLDDDNEGKNPPLLAQIPLDESIKPQPAPPLPRWVCSTQDVVGDVFDNPSYHRQTCSQFQQASYFLA
jgi:hypothetical protein